MRTGIKLLLSIFIVSLVHTSCIKGCIDNKALNYDPEATTNKGCIYPDVVNLTSVGVKYYPANDGQGNSWDVSGSPDKFIKIFNDETGVLLFTSTVELFTPVTWTIDPILSFEADEVTLRFELYDQDDTEDVLMDKAILNFNNLTGTSATLPNDFYPESTLLNGDNATGFTLNMTWTE